jgi:hypothetical protein
MLAHMLEQLLTKLRNELDDQKFYNADILYAYLKDYAVVDNEIQNEIKRYRLLTNAYNVMFELSNAADKTFKIEIIKIKYISLGFSNEAIDWLLGITTSVLKIPYNTHTKNNTTKTRENGIENIDVVQYKPSKKTFDQTKVPNIKNMGSHIQELKHMGISIDLPKAFKFAEYISDGISVSNGYVTISFTKTSLSSVKRYNIETSEQMANFVFKFATLAEKSSMVINEQDVPYGIYAPLFDSKSTQFSFFIKREAHIYVSTFKCESDKASRYRNDIFGWISTIEFAELA